MSCLKNPKKILWFNYYGTHDEEILYAGKFMLSSQNFRVRFKCKKCGAERTQSFVEWDELLRLGMSNKEIEKARNQIF